MRILIWSVRAILFLFVFGFAVKNADNVPLNFYAGKVWDAPLCYIILVAFAVGALLGVTATITSLLRQQRELSRLRKQLDRAQAAVENGRELSASPEAESY